MRTQRTWRARVRTVVDGTPLTVRGLLLVSISALALWFYGFGSLDLLVFVVGVSGLCLYGVAAVATSGVALFLARRVRGQTTESRTVECGSLLRTGFRVPALGWLPLTQIQWEWAPPSEAHVRPRQTDDLLFEEVIASRRALTPELTRRFSVQDAFGLSRVVWYATEVGETLLMPHVGKLRQTSMLPSLSGADGIPNPSGTPEGDRMEIRPYAPGDSVRNIIWSWYAKTRQLVVRTPERAVDRSRRVVAYLVAGPGDEAAAAAARVCLEQGALGENWAFGADGTPGLQATVPDALRAIARSGSIPRSAAPGTPSDAPHGLREFMRLAAVEGDVHCIVFAAAGGGPWVPHVLEVLREYPSALSFVLGTDGIDRPRAQQLWRRLVLVDERELGTPAEAVASLVRLLTHAGSRVVIADRPNGRYYAEAASVALGATA